MHNRLHQLISHHRVLKSLLELLLVVEVVGADVGVGLLVGGEGEWGRHGVGIYWGYWGCVFYWARGWLLFEY